MIRDAIIIGAPFNTRNMGVSALASGAIRCIRNSWPEARIRMVDYARQPENHEIQVDGNSVNVPLVNIRFSKNPLLENHVVRLILTAILGSLFPDKIRDRIVGSNKTLRRIDSADICYSISGGDSFSDIYGLRRFIYVTLPQILFIVLGKPLVQLPQTYGPYKTAISRAITRYILLKSEKIWSRDRRGREVVEKLIGIIDANKKFHISYDLGFMLEPKMPSEPDYGFDLNTVQNRDTQLIGINISGLLYKGGYDGKNMFGLSSDYKDMMDRLITYLVSERNFMVILVPHVFGSDGNFENDIAACEDIRERLSTRLDGGLFVANGDFDQHSIKWVISLCDLFIGSRMHACIAATSLGIPTISIAYSDKFLGVMEMIGCQSLVADARTLTFDDLVKLVDALLEKQNFWAEHLKNTMPEVMETIMQMFKSDTCSSNPVESVRA